MDSSGSGVLMVTVEVTSERSSLKAGISISGGEGGGSGYPDVGSSICTTSCSREVASLFVLLLGWFSVGICKYKSGYTSHDLL